MSDQKHDARGRRSFVKLVAAGGLGAAALAAGATEKAPADAKAMQKLPWPYAALDPDKTGDRGFAGYAKGHCMYGVFEALVGPAAERLGPPYDAFPFEVMTFGAGGVSGWATLCGALNGAAAAFQLLSPKPDPLVDALFDWYEREALPDYVPAAAKFPNVKSVAGSPLCHASISRWCEASGKKSFSAERKERCQVITGAVARKAAMLLNDQAAGKPIPVLVIGEERGCMKCHEKGGQLENTRSKMRCGGCHDMPKDHGSI